MGKASSWVKKKLRGKKKAKKRVVGVAGSEDAPPAAKPAALRKKLAQHDMRKVVGKIKGLRS